MAEEATVIFQPAGNRGKVKIGETLLAASRQLGGDLESLCGGNKVCGKCKVRIEAGVFDKFGLTSSQAHASPWLEEEGAFISPGEREQGYRLACCAQVTGDILLFVPEEARAGKQVVSKEARSLDFKLDPAVKLYYVEMPPPAPEDPLGDLDRLYQALQREYGLAELSIDIHALQDLGDLLRRGDWKVTVSLWMEREVLRVRPGRHEHHYGMAIDLGTTTLAGYLCDLSNGEVVATASQMNPQCKYGEDIMSRVSYAINHSDGLAKMHHEIVGGINQLMTAAVEEVEREPGGIAGADSARTLSLDDIEDLVVVGNTVMHHVLLGLNPRHVAVSPFTPALQHSLDLKARRLGLRLNPAVYLHTLPLEAGFVGADNVGVLLAERPHEQDRMQLIIDIGTNGELVLGNRQGLACTSCATGPALEGAQITHGMRAAPGAIERIRIYPGEHRVDYKVVGKDAWRSHSRPQDMQVKGICGSGVLDLLAELYRGGIIDKSGAFAEDLESPRYRQDPETQMGEFVIAWAPETSIDKDIVVTQKDIRQIQLAKSALYSGCKLLLKHMGNPVIEEIKICGAFGVHVDKEQALIMGLFPDIALERIKAVGNAAGDGARLALLDHKLRQEAQRVASQVTYVELSGHPDFQEEFLGAIEIPHASDPFPHLKGLVPPEILEQT